MVHYSYDEECRFWMKVDMRLPNQCWIWTASTKSGRESYRRYGVYPRWDEETQKYRERLAHRVAYELGYGEIPEGLDVCHTCDVPLCVNPWHLFADTHAGNMADMARKGRATRKRGEQANGAILTDEQVCEAFRLYNTGGFTQEQVGRLLGVTEAAISNALRGRTWRHLDLQVTFHRKHEGVAAVGAAKTHCPQGHPYSGANLALRQGRRVCRICEGDRQRRYIERKKARLIGDGNPSFTPSE